MATNSSDKASSTAKAKANPNAAFNRAVPPKGTPPKGMPPKAIPRFNKGTAKKGGKK